MLVNQMERETWVLRHTARRSLKEFGNASEGKGRATSSEDSTSSKLRYMWLMRPIYTVTCAATRESF